MKNIVIIDADSVVHKSFSRAEEWKDQSGNCQRVLKGLLNSILSASYEISENIDMLYIVFDPEDSRNYRMSIKDNYKCNRPPHDPDLIRQKRFAIKVLRSVYGWPVFDFPGYEADDIIGTLVHNLKQDKSNYISFFSPDKDLMQLLDKNILQFKKERGGKYTRINEQYVFEHFGIKPTQVADWLALIGDTVDNIVGVDKLGKIKAAKLLQKYWSVEHIIAFANELQENNKTDKYIKEQIKNNKADLIINKKLALIKTDVDIKEYENNIMKLITDVQTDEDKYNRQLIRLQKFCNLSNKFIEPFLK